MAVMVDTVYEDGVLKPAEALPFREHEKVRVTVVPHSSWVQDTAGIFGWKGDLRSFRQPAH
jgi:predicted DNA-binding antitoxin AbrB/MazE fold protein